MPFKASNPAFSRQVARLFWIRPFEPGELLASMCNLYSITGNQEAIRALFRKVNRYFGNLAPMTAVSPITRPGDPQDGRRECSSVVPLRYLLRVCRPRARRHARASCTEKAFGHRDRAIARGMDQGGDPDSDDLEPALHQGRFVVTAPFANETRSA
jgi:hypothetical protein